MEFSFKPLSTNPINILSMIKVIVSLGMKDYDYSYEYLKANPYEFVTGFYKDISGNLQLGLPG